MPRPQRIELAGALYHVTSRGDRREPIFHDDADRYAFLELLAEVARRFQWRCYAYCLMSNHYHLLVEPLTGQLSDGMHYLNGVYTQKFNHRHGKVGHVFQGRFHSQLIQKDSHFAEAIRYIVLNPVRAHLVAHPVGHEWSSYAATAGLCVCPAWLAAEAVLALFAGPGADAVSAYVKFVEAGIGTPADAGLNQRLAVGDEGFIAETAAAVVARSATVPKWLRVLGRPELSRLLPLRPGVLKAERNTAIAVACHRYGYTIREVAHHLSVNVSTVSRIVSTSRKAGGMREET